MKKRIALAAGALALTSAVAVPTSGAFGLSQQHCFKIQQGLSTAYDTIGSTNSHQVPAVQNNLEQAGLGLSFKCPLGPPGP